MCIYFESKDLVIFFEHITDYREKVIVASYLGFCMDCYSAEEPDYNNLNYIDNLLLKPRKGKFFIDIAVDHILPSYSSDNKTYKKSLEKMRQELVKNRINFSINWID